MTFNQLVEQCLKDRKILHPTAADRERAARDCRKVASIMGVSPKALAESWKS